MANRDFNKIKRTIQDFSQNAGDGSNGGSEIVDALPAQGKEGTTYLLRKTEESVVFKAHCYNVIYCQGEAEYWGNILVGEGDILSQLRESLEKRIDPSLSEGVVDFRRMSPIFSQVSPSEWQNFINNTSTKTIVRTEQDVLAINESVYYIIQDLGEIGIEDLNVVEVKFVPEVGKYLAMIICSLPNSLIDQELFRDNEVIHRTRQVNFIYEPEQGDAWYSFTEWDEEVMGPLVGTLTDTYIYDPEVLLPLEQGDAYRIILTPEVPAYTYSYTQYVFDKGVYTVVGSESGGGNRVVEVLGGFPPLPEQGGGTWYPLTLDKTNEEIVALANNGPVYLGIKPVENVVNYISEVYIAEFSNNNFYFKVMNYWTQEKLVEGSYVREIRFNNETQQFEGIYYIVSNPQ